MRILRRLKEFPSSSFVKGDDRPHVLLDERSVDQGGNVDSGHPLHAMEVGKGLVGKIPAKKQIEGTADWKVLPLPADEERNLDEVYS